MINTLNTSTFRTDITHLNRAFMIDSARAIIRRGLSLGQRPFVSTKFGPESAVLLHLLVQEAVDIPVVWIDTGYNTRTTMRYAELIRQRLRLNLKTFQPQQATFELPPELDDPAHEAFTRRVKLEPFARAMETLQPDVWFSGLRREQTAYRAGLDIVSYSESGLFKVTPLLDWNHADMQAYLMAYDLAPESDYTDDDYYDPTKGEPRRECGLHLSF